MTKTSALLVVVGLLAGCATPRRTSLQSDDRADLGAAALDDLASAAATTMTSDLSTSATDLAGALPCFALSNDPDDPLAIDGAFDTQTPRWRRPHDEEPICPASALLPTTAADVPFAVYAFCNQDTKSHAYLIEWLAVEGPLGEAPLDDPYLVVYDGNGIASDARQCRAVNDDVPDALDAKDSELRVTVPPGQAITIVGTTYTYAPDDGTGQGGWILVVSVDD